MTKVIARGQISVVTVEDGQSPVVYSLAPSCTAVHEDKSGVKTPATVSARAVLSVGAEREVIGVDPKIDFVGRNLMRNSLCDNSSGWASNGGASVDVETFDCAVWKINNTFGNGFYMFNFLALRCNNQLVVGDKCVISYDIYVLAETRFGMGFGDVSNQQTHTNVGVWTRASATQVCTAWAFTAYCGKTAAQYFFIKNIKIERLGLSNTQYVSAPEDFYIKRNSQSYVPGAAIAPTNDTVFTLHEPSNGAVVDTETVPLTLDGVDGANAPRLKVQFSINGSTLWHDTYASSDRYRRESNDNGTTWGAAMRMWGETGQPGADGKKTPYTDFAYAYGITQPTAWSDAPPAKVEGQHLWERIQKYTPNADNSGWDLVSTSYAIINEYIEIGGVNLALNTGIEASNAYYPTRTFALSENLIPQTLYTATFKGELGEGRTGFELLMGGGYTFINKIPQTSNGHYQLTFKCPSTVAGTGRFDQVSVYAMPNGSSVSKISKFKIERGNRATDWHPAPEDVQAEIDAAKAEAEKRQNELAQSIGYDSWADLEAMAKAGQTIIEGGKINTVLIETTALVTKLLKADSGFVDTLVAKLLKADSGFIDQLIVNRLKTAVEGSSQRVEAANNQLLIFDDNNKVCASLTGEPMPSHADFSAGGSSGQITIPQQAYDRSYRYGSAISEKFDFASYKLIVPNDRTNIIISGTIYAQMYNRVGDSYPNPLSGSVALYLLSSDGTRRLVGGYSQTSYSGDDRSERAFSETVYMVAKGTYTLQLERTHLHCTTDRSFSLRFGLSGNTTFRYERDEGVFSTMFRAGGYGVRGNRYNYEHTSFDPNYINDKNVKTGLLTKTIVGQLDAPNVALVGYDVTDSGTINHRFGAKANPTGNATYLGYGKYQIPHNIGHTQYNVIAMATGVDDNVTNVLREISNLRTDKSCVVRVRDLNNQTAVSSFTVTIFGKNYV